MELERFYNIIQENCGGFPLVKIAAKLWKEQGERYNTEEKPDNSAISKYKDTGWKEVVEKIRSLREAQEERMLQNSEIDIICDYDDLYYVYKLISEVSPLVMPDESKDIYLRKVKEDVDNRIPVNLDRVRASVQKRHEEYQKIYGEHEDEVIEKISKSIANLQNAFNERSRMLEPEPDRTMDLYNTI
jgi:hypothetical protein